MSTSHQGRQAVSKEFIFDSSDDGIVKVCSKRTEHQVVTDASLKRKLKDYQDGYEQLELFVMQGLVPVPNVTHLRDNLNIAANSTQRTKCLGKTRQEAVCEAEQASKQAKKAWMSKPVGERGLSKMRFRSCRDKSQVIQFKNDAYKNGTWFPTKVKGLLYCTAWGYEVPQKCEYGTELVYQRGQWFACFPQYKSVIVTGSDKVIAFDPGNRCFLTGYDGENILEIGKGDIGRITRLCLHLDKLISQKVKAKGKANKRLRYKLQLAIRRLRFKISCLVDDLHRKTTNLIVNTYKLVFLPTYETSQMVLKATRKINKKSVRNMLSWAFGRFAEHLEQAAKRQGVLIIRINESYTSKTCPHCGKIHHKLGGNKVFKCPSCGFNYPRDWVGAVNNLLAALQAIAFSVQDNQISIGTPAPDVRVAHLS